MLMTIARYAPLPEWDGPWHGVAKRGRVDLYLLPQPRGRVAFARNRPARAWRPTRRWWWEYSERRKRYQWTWQQRLERAAASLDPPSPERHAGR